MSDCILLANIEMPRAMERRVRGIVLLSFDVRLHVGWRHQTHGSTAAHIHGARVPVEEVAVGTEIALRPPHRSRRALLTHRAPMDGDEEPLFGPRVQDAWERQVSVSD